MSGTCRLICAFGLMLDKNLLYGPGLINEKRIGVVSKEDLVNYAIYLHTRGGIYDDLKLTLEQLRVRLQRMTKGRLVSSINARLISKPRAHTAVKGVNKKDGSNVSVKLEHMKQKLIN